MMWRLIADDLTILPSCSTLHLPRLILSGEADDW